MSVIRAADPIFRRNHPDADCYDPAGLVACACFSCCLRWWACWTTAWLW